MLSKGSVALWRGVCEILSYNGWERFLEYCWILKGIGRGTSLVLFLDHFEKKRSLYSDQTFETIAVLIVWGNVSRLPIFLELFFHGTNSRLNIHGKTTSRENIWVNLRVRKYAFPVVGSELSDVSIPPWVVSGAAAPVHPVGRQGGQGGVVHGRLVPLVVAVHGTVERSWLRGVRSRWTGGRGLQAAKKKVRLIISFCLYRGTHKNCRILTRLKLSLNISF